MADQDEHSGARAGTAGRAVGRRRFTRCRGIVAGAVVLATGAAGLTFAVNPASADHPTYDDLDIGSSLPVERSGASLVNDNGSVVIFAYTPTEFGGESQIYSWTADDGAVDIGNLGVSDNLGARAINASGQIIGSSRHSPTNPYPHAFIWTPGGTMVDLGTFGGPSSEAMDINDAGIVVGSAASSPDESQAFVWTEAGGKTNLGAIGRSSFALDVNEPGAVIGLEYAWADPVTGLVPPTRSFYWTPELGKVDLGDLGRDVQATALNDSGLVTGTARGADGVYHAFVWTLAGGMVDLGSPLGGGTFPTAINESGQVIGQAYTTNDDVGQAFFWSEATGFVFLPIADLEEPEPEAINSSGQVVGWGDSTTDGEEHIFIWNLTDGYRDLGEGSGDDINDSGQIAARRYVHLDDEFSTILSVAHLLSPSVEVVPDADGDGIEDLLEVAGQPTAFADTNVPVTFGSVVDPAGHTVTITEAAAPEGVQIVVSGVGTVKATFSVCGMTLRLAPGADVVVTCGSLSTRVVSGEAEVVTADGRVAVTVPSGSTVKVTDLGDGRHEVEHVVGTADVMVSVDGAVPTAVVPGGTTTVASRDTIPPVVVCAAAPTFTIRQAGASVSATVSDDDSGPASASVSATVDVSGVGSFTAPVTGADVAGNVTTVDCPYSVVYRVEWLLPVSGISASRSVLRNTVVPFTFRIVDAGGRAVLGAHVAATTSVPATCPAGTPPLAVSVPGNAATTNAGLGWWLASWKTQTAWKGTCRLVSINLDDGVARTVLIKVV